MQNSTPKTRFNPSTTGALHLGHIYALLVNEKLAHDNNGKFYIRFDDTSQAVIIEMDQPSHIEGIIKQQQADIEWLGIKVDGWQFQSDVHEEVRKELMKYKPYILPDPYPHYLPVSIRMGNSWISYPYTPYQTAERVILDHMLGITHVIRGDDFLSEYALYCYFCDVMDRPKPEISYLPRLTSTQGDISKTNGGFTIAEMRGQGYTADEIIRLLECACLIYPNNGWNFYNLRANPKVAL